MGWCNMYKALVQIGDTKVGEEVSEKILGKDKVKSYLKKGYIEEAKAKKDSVEEAKAKKGK